MIAPPFYSNLEAWLNFTSKLRPKKLTDDDVADLLIRAGGDSCAVRTVAEHPEQFGLVVLKSRLTPEVVAHAQHLESRREREISEWVRSFVPRIRTEEPVGVPTSREAPEQVGGSPSGKRSSIYGHPVTAVIRWMGEEGWPYEKAKITLERLKVGVAKATITAQLLAGRKGTRGAAAPLTEEQANELYVLAVP